MEALARSCPCPLAFKGEARLLFAAISSHLQEGSSGGEASETSGAEDWLQRLVLAAASCAGSWRVGRFLWGWTNYSSSIASRGIAQRSYGPGDLHGTRSMRCIAQPRTQEHVTRFGRWAEMVANSL